MLDPFGAISSIPYPGEDPRPYLLDLHVLLTDHLPEVWFENCMESIFHAEGRAPYRTEIHYGDEIIGNEWAARKAAYSYGSAPYVAKVDVDSWLDQDALLHIHEGMLRGDPAIVTNGIGYDASKGGSVALSRGLVATRRELLDVIDWPNQDRECCPERAMMKAAGSVTWVHKAGLHRRVGYSSLGAIERKAERENALG